MSHLFRLSPIFSILFCITLVFTPKRKTNTTLICPPTINHNIFKNYDTEILSLKIFFPVYFCSFCNKPLFFNLLKILTKKSTGIFRGKVLVFVLLIFRILIEKNTV